MKRIARLFIIFSLLYITTIVYGAKPPGFEEKKIHQPIDVIATGGAGIAGYEKFGMIFLNPASLGMGSFSDFSILQAGVKANYSLYELYKLGEPYITDPSSFDLASLTMEQWKAILNINANLGIIGPITLGYIGKGLGVLLYDDVKASFIIKQGPGMPYFDVGVYVDIGFILGYGREIPLPRIFGKLTYAKLYAGINVKFINRFKYENPRMSLLEGFDLASSFLSLDRGILMGQNLGADIGLIFQPSKFLTIGIVARDILSTGFSWAEYQTNFQKITNSEPIPNTYFYPSLDVGVALRALRGRVVLSDLTFYFDIINSLDLNEHYLLKLRIGAELTVLRFLKLRAGFYKGYPTLGVGFNFPLLKINAAYYTEELGEIPGSLPQSTIMLDVELVI